MIAGITEAGPKGRRLHFYHPNAILRVAGLPFSAVERLATGRSHEALRRLIALREESGANVASACAHLERAIGSSEFTQDERRLLLTLKRKLFNAKVLDLAPLDGVLSRLSPDARETIAHAARAVRDIAEIESRFDDIYGAESGEASARLRMLSLESEEFMRGIVYSAPLVAQDLIASRSAPQKFIGKAGRQLDLGLSNFFVRAGTKVSPLSYFTPVAVARCTEDGVSALDLGERSVRSDIVMARQALYDVLGGIAKSLKFWGDGHPLILNPTLRAEATLVTYTDTWSRGPASGRTWGIRQSTVQLPITPRLAALCEFYASAPHGRGYTLRELYDAFGSNLFKGEPNAFAGFIAQAMRVGLLHPELEFFEQEDGAESLLDLLRSHQPEASQLLERVSEGLSLFGSANHAQRLLCTKAVSEAFTDLCESVGLEYRPEAKSPLFYEDCYLDGPPVEVSRNALGTGIDDLYRLTDLLPLMDSTHVVQSVMAAVFVRRYGEGAVVGALECFDAIADEGATLAQGLAALPLDQQVDRLKDLSGTGHALLDQKRRLLEALHARVVGHDDVALDEEFVESFVGAIPEPVRERPSSYTVIGQLDDTREDPRFVINRLYSGHTMLMSRFLLQLDEASLLRVSTYLQALAPGHQLVEIPGVFGFNANLHPRFTDAELKLPGRRPSYRDTRKIDIASLFVRYDARLDRLAVVDSDGRAHSLCYFGFLNIMALASMYQMLGKMHLQGLVPDLWQDLYFAGYLNTNDGPTHLARLSFGNLILSRKSLLIPGSTLPSTDASAPVFFRDLHATLGNLGIREPQYARLVAQRDDFVASEGEAGDAMTTAFKPAYLDFDIPLTVSALQRRLQRRRRSVLLQESLPRVGDSGITWRGQRHACEMQFEISQAPEK